MKNLDADALLTLNPDSQASTYIAGQDLPLEQTIANMPGQAPAPDRRLQEDACGAGQGGRGIQLGLHIRVE
ncbi:MAG: hypothetical protein JSS57_13140 [Proteobacteria bacterium]|nr:hypothetical protein [Pseudomonadota bacterium]